MLTKILVGDRALTGSIDNIPPRADIVQIGFFYEASILQESKIILNNHQIKAY